MTDVRRVRVFSRCLAAAVPLFTVAAGGCAHAQPNPGQPRPQAAPALFLTPLVGQPIPVLPASFVTADSGVTGVPATREALLGWTDSVLAAALEARGPEATWVLPAELRRVARRAPGILTDPDHMSQAVMRFPGLKRVPDPLFSNIRTLVAFTGSRYVMIPAAFRFTRVADGVEVESVLVLADARNGSIPWRSVPVATAATAGAALAATIARVLPDLH